MDFTALIRETLELVDPNEENEDMELLAGLLAWAAKQGDAFAGWDRETVSAAVRATYQHDSDKADQVLSSFEETVYGGEDEEDDEGFDVYLYRDAADEALEDGSDELVRGFPSSSEARSYADHQVASGAWARAIVGRGERVHELYDSARGWIG